MCLFVENFCLDGGVYMCVCATVVRAITSYWCHVSLSPIKSNELGMFSPNIIVTDSDWRIQLQLSNRKHPHSKHARPSGANALCPPQSDDRSLRVQWLFKRGSAVHRPHDKGLLRSFRSPTYYNTLDCHFVDRASRYSTWLRL